MSSVVVDICDTSSFRASFQTGWCRSLHIPLTPETQNMLNEKVFKTMKPNAYLINCARGGIVNEDDLSDAL